jgi:hypothetical protein
MPSPIQASSDLSQCTLPEDVSAEESDAQMSLTSAHAVANASQSSASAPAAQPAPTAAASPAVSALVSRFTAPSGAHPPVEPSRGRALLNCSVELANVALTAGLVAAAIPETAGASLLAGARVGLAAVTLMRCVERDEAKQIQDGYHANQAADCRSEGAIPLTTQDGSVVCAR